MVEAFKTMAANNAWANATLFGAATRLPETAAHDPAPGFFPTLSRTLNHIHEVDLYYLDAIEQKGLGRAVYRRDDIPAMADLAEAQAKLDARLIRFCAKLTPEMLLEMRPTERHEETVHEEVQALLLHLFQHQVHHRGQAHVQLHALGIDPPQLDDFHLRYDRALSAQVYWQ
ncbi:DinB family protein [uncultured Roseobacter sp.]|uniref:DinB family protein n=1 Tax=uncultured Roseobacter sp. TaxID=114847 RepID=UPI002604BEC2|nr:DinB family protein [uncultured Roseobacter sp.]